MYPRIKANSKADVAQRPPKRSTSEPPKIRSTTSSARTPACVISDIPLAMLPAARVSFKRGACRLSRKRFVLMILTT